MICTIDRACSTYRFTEIDKQLFVTLTDNQMKGSDIVVTLTSLLVMIQTEDQGLETDSLSYAILILTMFLDTTII